MVDNGSGIITEAIFYITGAVISPTAEGGVQTTATTSNSLNDVVNVTVSSSPEGMATAIVNINYANQSVATFDIPGTQTIVDADGNVENEVLPLTYIDPNGCVVKAKVIMMNTGESLSGFIRDCYGEITEQPTTDPSTPFELGNKIRVYEADEKLKIEVNATITRPIIF